MSSNKILDGIMGLCVGDALGVPVEFKGRNELRLKPVKSMIGHGTHWQPKGTWSDDGSMTLCTLDSLQNGYNLNDIADKFVKWYKKNLWSARGSVFDIGIATEKALENILNGYSPLESGLYGEWDNGNGSLMRILPLAYHLKNTNTEEKLRIIREVSSITHGHDISVFCCIFYIEYAINLLKGKDKFQAYNDTIKFIKPRLAKVPGLTLKFGRVLSGNIHLFEESEIESSGFVLHTL